MDGDEGREGRAVQMGREKNLKLDLAIPDRRRWNLSGYS